MPPAVVAPIDGLKKLCQDDREALAVIEKETQWPSGRPEKTYDNVQAFPLAPIDDTDELERTFKIMFVGMCVLIAWLLISVASVTLL